MPVVPITFAPDLDTAWSVSPGALKTANYLAPLRNGAYGSMGTVNNNALTGSDALFAKMFRQISGAVRFLVFRVGNIDEYTNAGVRTNRGTGYNALTTDWDATAWGNQIIATNFLDAPQSSTGAGFTALSGSPPKARRVAANQNFVMFADVDDGGSNVYPDMVWWGGLRNPATWTPSPATMAGNIRLLDAPGPITGLVAFRDTFVVFKANAIFVGQFVGPPYVFTWRMVSNRVGCVAPHSIVELNGRLYFMHHAGIYEFDGSQIRDIGRPIFQSFLGECGWVTIPGKGAGVGMPPIATTSGLAVTQAAVDDLDSVVWFAAYGTNGGTTYATLYGYNQVSQKWGRLSSVSGTTSTSTHPMVQATYADITSFGPVDMTFNEARFFMIPQGALYYIRYPIASSNVALTTGVLGSVERSDGTVRVWPRTLVGSSTAPFASGTIAGFTDEAGNLANGTATLTANSEFDSLDGKLAAKYRTVSIVGGTSKIAIIAGLDIEGAGYPTRR